MGAVLVEDILINKQKYVGKRAWVYGYLGRTTYSYIDLSTNLTDSPHLRIMPHPEMGRGSMRADLESLTVRVVVDVDFFSRPIDQCFGDYVSVWGHVQLVDDFVVIVLDDPEEDMITSHSGNFEKPCGW